MKRSEKRESPAGEPHEQLQGWRRRMLRGTEQSPEEELRQSQDVLSWATRTHGADSSFTIKARIEVADQLARQDRRAEEADQREQIVAALGSSLGPDTLNTVAAEMRLAGCLVRWSASRTRTGCSPMWWRSGRVSSVPTTPTPSRR